MADKRLADQNLRWLHNVRREIAALQELAITASVECTRESPDVDWAVLEKAIARISASVSYAKAAGAERATT
jgi:hypothetical protein